MDKKHSKNWKEKTEIMNEELSKIELIKQGDETLVVLQENMLFTMNKKEYVIPAGFVSDGASLPRFFWRLIGHPFDMKYLPEAIIHDYLYKTQPCTRAEADKYFYDILADNNLGFRRQLIYAGLRIGGFVAWNEHATNNQQK